METEKVLNIVLREMTAIGRGWRGSWSDFDGRTLRNQLNEINDFAINALKSETDIDFTDGTRFEKEHLDF